MPQSSEEPLNQLARSSRSALTVAAQPSHLEIITTAYMDRQSARNRNFTYLVHSLRMRATKIYRRQEWSFYVIEMI
jgi:hypothetical protein